MSPIVSTRTLRSIWRDDDLDVLVVDLHALAAVDVLDLAEQVLLHGLFAGDPEDVVRHQRPVDQRLAGPDEVAGVDAQVLAVRDQVLALDARLAADDDRPLAAALLAAGSRRVPSISAMTAGSLGLRASKISVTRGRPPVMSCVPARLAGRLGQDGAGGDLLALRRPRCGPSRAGSRSRGSCRSPSSMTICGCRSPLCSMIDAADVAGGRPSRSRMRLALDDVLEADLAAHLGQDRDAVRVPLAEQRARLRPPGRPRPACSAPSGTSYFSSSRPLGSRTGSRRCASGRSVWPSSLTTTLMPANLTMPSRLRLDLASPRRPRVADAADVEGPHRQLRARLADRLGGDDADGHALFDQRAGRQVHAVAELADAQRRLAGHRAADLDLLQPQLLDLVGRSSAVIISFSRTITSSVIGLTMFARLTRPRIDSARPTSTFSPL